jgi:hypothetical protein
MSAQALGQRSPTSVSLAEDTPLPQDQSADIATVCPNEKRAFGGRPQPEPSDLWGDSHNSLGSKGQVRALALPIYPSERHLQGNDQM